MIYYNGAELIQMMVLALILVIITIIASIFSPFGLGFIVFSIIRAKTSNETMKKVSLAFQIILLAINFIFAILISLLFSIRDSGFYVYGQGIVMTVAVIIGASLIFLIGLAVIIFKVGCKREKFA